LASGLLASKIEGGLAGLYLKVVSAPVESAIFDLLAERGPGKTICPSEAARALDPEGWRRLMPHVRATAVGLARAGRLEITRHGKAADPNAFKGVYRLRLPAEPS
jgi:hypothetical protein